MTRPLAGVTVLGVELAIAAPLCTRHLSDLGARVIKVEHPGGGDTTRGYDTVARGLAAHFVWLNHGKESAALDLTVDADRDVFRRLVAKADVLVCNLAPGALGRLGFAPVELARTHPRLVAVEISGYGTGGAIDHRRAYDLLIQSEGGSCAITGSAGMPAKPGIPIADVATALYAQSAVLAALYDRERTGRGAYVPIAMLDCLAELMGWALNQTIHGGGDPVPVGLGSPMVAPYGAYETGDGQQVVLGTTSDREWQRLSGDLIDRPDLAADPRYATNAQRCAARGELDAAIGAWCAERPLEEIQRLADACKLGNARLNGVSDLAVHPQLSQRGRWDEIDSPVGPLPALRPPALADAWGYAPGRVPALGEDTDAIRAEFS